MGLTMGQRKALTREMAARYRGASRPQRKAMLDESSNCTAAPATTPGGCCDRPAAAHRETCPAHTRALPYQADHPPDEPDPDPHLHREWQDARPGEVGADLVGHDGGITGGEHAFTLVLTDRVTSCRSRDDGAGSTWSRHELVGSVGLLHNRVSAEGFQGGPGRRPHEVRPANAWVPAPYHLRSSAWTAPCHHRTGSRRRSTHRRQRHDPTWGHAHRRMPSRSRQTSRTPNASAQTWKKPIRSEDGIAS